MDETRVNMSKSHAEHVKKKFADVIRGSLDEISNAVLVSLSGVLQSTNTKLKITDFEEQFKMDIVGKGLEDFDSHWNEKDLSHHTMWLKMRETEADSTKKGIEKSWRPFGRSAEDQTQNHRLRAMTAYIVELEDILSQQTENLQQVLYGVEEKRANFNRLSKRREGINEQIESRIAQVQSELLEIQDTQIKSL